MSKVGRRPIRIPPNVQVTIDSNNGREQLRVKGPKGELSLNIDVNFVATFKDQNLTIVPKSKELNGKIKTLWGLQRALLNNMVQGVSVGFEKKLEVEGIGYRAHLQGDKLILNVGYSHPVEIVIPKGVEVKVEKNILSISGIDKYLVGQFAAKIRAIKPPEPYKGKGIKYQGEIIRRKAGKKAVSAA